MQESIEPQDAGDGINKDRRIKMDNEQTIGGRLKYAIKMRNLKQTEFAKQIAIADGTLSRFITDKRKPDADMIVLICKKLQISSDWLLGLM